MKSALIGNCSHSEYPLIDILLNEGYDVYSIGADQSAYYSKKVKHHYIIDYTDLNSLKIFFSNHSFDIYIPACNELFIKTMLDLDLGHLFGLDDPQTQKNMVDKRWLSLAFAGLKYIKIPQRLEVSRSSFKHDPSVISFFKNYNAGLLKPVTSAGGVGISLVRNMKELSDLVLSSSLGEHHVLEEIISGPEFALSV